VLQPLITTNKEYHFVINKQKRYIEILSQAEEISAEDKVLETGRNNMGRF
jgi:hypothetical protein